MMGVKCLNEESMLIRAKFLKEFKMIFVSACLEE